MYILRIILSKQTNGRNMKGKTISKFLGVASICCFSAVSMYATMATPGPNIPALVERGATGDGIFSNNGEVLSDLAKLKASKNAIARSIATGSGTSFLFKRIELDAGNPASSLDISGAGNLVGLQPGDLLNPKAAAMLKPLFIVKEGFLTFSGGSNLVNLPFTVRGNLRQIEKQPLDILNRGLTLSDVTVTQTDKDAAIIEVIGGLAAIGGVGAPVSFLNFADSPLEIKAVAAIADFNNVSFDQGNFHVHAGPGAIFDLSGLAVNEGAILRRVDIAGDRASVAVSDVTNIFPPSELTTRTKIFGRNGGIISFLDNFNDSGYMAVGAALISVESLKGAPAGCAKNQFTIAVAPAKTVNLRAIRAELARSGDLTIVGPGSSDGTLSFQRLIIERTRSDTRPRDLSILRNRQSRASDAFDTLSRRGNLQKLTQVQKEGLKSNLVAWALKDASVEVNELPSRFVKLDGTFESAGNFLVQQVSGEPGAGGPGEYQPPAAQAVALFAPAFGLHAAEIGVEDATNNKWLAIKRRTGIGLAKNAVFSSAGKVVAPTILAFRMDPGSSLTAEDDIELLGGSDLNYAQVVTSGSIHLDGALFLHRHVDTEITAAEMHVHPKARLQLSSTAIAGDLTIHPLARVLIGAEGSGPLSALAASGAPLQAGKLGAPAVQAWNSSVDADLTLQDGSSIATLGSPCGSSEGLDVAGSLIIGEGVKAMFVPADGCFSKKIRTAILVRAPAVTGEFDGVLSDSDLFKVALVRNDSVGSTEYSINFQRLELAKIAALTDVLPVKMLVAMDKLLDKAADSPALCSKLAKLKLLSSADILETLQGVQPSQLKALAMSQENNAVNVRNTLSIRFQRELDAMHCASSATPSGTCDVKAKPVHVWATGFGDNMYQGQVSDFGYGFQNNMGGFSAGVDYHFADVLYAGALGAYTSSDIDWLNGRGSGDITTGYAGLYMSAISKMYWGTIAVLGGWSDYSSDRNFLLQNNRFNFSNSHNGSQILSHADTGINFGFKGFTIRPFDSFDYISQSENSFHEKGNGPVNIEIDDQTSIMIRNELGINFAGCFCIRGMQWTVSPKISWVREVRVKGKTINAEFEDVDQSFEVDGYFPSRSLVSPGITLQGNFKDDLFTVGLYYNGVFQGNYSDHSYGGQIRFGF